MANENLSDYQSKKFDSLCCHIKDEDFINNKRYFSLIYILKQPTKKKNKINAPKSTIL